MTARLPTASAALVIAVLCCAACAGNPPPQAANAATAEVSVATLYPLDAGWKWAYTVIAQGKTPVLATYAVIARLGDMAVVQAGDERITYLVSAEGLARREELGGGRDFLIKAPLGAGAAWQVTGGTAKVTAVEKEVTVEAGRFQHCVTVEEARENPRRLVRTTYAPGAGPILIEVMVDQGEGLVPSVRASLLGVTRPGEDPTAGAP